MDHLSPSSRRKLMQKVRTHRTEPERMVEKLLRKLRLRFKRNSKSLPGSPDFVLPERHRAIFVHGCFWHFHRDCKRSSLPSSHRDFWLNKLESNRRRDNKVKRQLNRMGWRVITIWQCELKKVDIINKKLDRAKRSMISNN